MFSLLEFHKHPWQLPSSPSGNKKLEPPGRTHLTSPNWPLQQSSAYNTSVFANLPLGNKIAIDSPELWNSVLPALEDTRCRGQTRVTAGQCTQPGVPGTPVQPEGSVWRVPGEEQPLPLSHSCLEGRGV